MLVQYCSPPCYYVRRRSVTLTFTETSTVQVVLTPGNYVSYFLFAMEVAVPAA